MSPTDGRITVASIWRPRGGRHHGAIVSIDEVKRHRERKVDHDAEDRAAGRLRHVHGVHRGDFGFDEPAVDAKASKPLRDDFRESIRERASGYA